MAKERKGRWNKRKNNNEAAYTGKDNINTPIALVKIIIRLLNYGRRSLKGCSPWGCWGSDTTERLHFHFSLSCIGEGNGNPLQCSCLENPRGGRAWWAAIYGVAQSRTRLKWLSSSSTKYTHWPSGPRHPEFESMLRSMELTSLVTSVIMGEWTAFLFFTIWKSCRKRLDFWN